MIKKTITYKDFLGVERTEDFYFNMTKAELFDLEIGGGPDGFTESLKRIAESGNARKIMDTFKSVILNAYGERSEDGRKFIKSQRISEEFASHAAYDELFVELVTDANAASEFINGLVPSDLAEQAERLKQNKTRPTPQDFKKPAEKKDSTVEVVGTPQVVTEEEPKKLTQEEIVAKIQSGEIDISAAQNFLK